MKKIVYPSSSIYLDANFLALFDCIDDLQKEEGFYLIDQNVYRMHQDVFFGFKKIIIIPPGEGTKSLVHINDFIEQLISLGANRKSYIIGIGGGVTCDITGFVASIFMRGVKFGFIPTTVLAITDAALGGKNGVNLNGVKNLIGVINEPNFVFVDYSFLRTLDIQEFANGFAEIIKHACVASYDLFVLLENVVVDYSSIDFLHKLILDSIKIKLRIVSNDINESNNRKLLNYGHTFGHAIEAEYNMPHGSSVSLGIIFSNILSNKLDLLDKEKLIRISNLLEKFDLPVEISRFNKKKLMKYINKDKKSSGKEIDFVVLKDIGEGFVKNILIEDIINE
ncbi:MAG: 3-dehydroquinate synthase [Flavobacteriales bacterium]|nr:3-dehydroquinate synthase [Flavobacteriales bacterium]